VIFHEFPIGRPGLGGFLDILQVDPSGIIRILGWSDSLFRVEQAPGIYLEGERVPFLQHFRYHRGDAALAVSSGYTQRGLALDYLTPDHLIGRSLTVLRLEFENGELEFEADFHFLNPNYRELLNSPDVWRREQIYGSGPPNVAVHPEVLDLAKELKGPVLDFGCGRGALIAALQPLGVEAYGLELNSDLLRQVIPPSLKSLITLYDGAFPSPFRDAQFRSVMCSEVLEHIPDYQSAVRDIARLTSESAVFTVPDASAIPVGFRHGSVPWHLLEGTHVNFFTQQSLHNALQPHFSKIEFGRVGLSRFNDSSYFVSLAAFCSK